jgi:hypothetical protein
VVTKVEWHQGELYPRVGFIVTNLTRPAERLVKFYNGRGTAEQWIREGKLALRWTRLSCRAFRDNAVHLQLFALRLQPRQLPAQSGAARRGGAVVVDDLARSWSRSAPGSSGTAATTCSSWPRWRSREHCSPRSCAGSTGCEDRPPVAA